jgi:surfeit locus 1 family protein
VSSRGWRAPPWAWVVTTAATALFVSLALWQAHRGQAKAALRDTLANPAPGAESLTARSAPPPALELQRARAEGTYLAETQLLQDGQSHAHRPGYHVWTPLQLRDGAIVLVNRGWVPRESAAIPAPPGDVAVRGFWRALPEPGLRLAAADNCPGEKKFPLVVLYPTAAEVACLLGPRVLAGLLLLDADLPGGFTREWADFGFPPERHYGYAFQWLALAIASVAVFLVVNRQRRDSAQP